MLVTLDQPPLRLEAREAIPGSVDAAAPLLAAWYDDPYNRSMMGATSTLSAPEVVRYFAEAASRGDRLFLLFVDGVLVGDSDLRSITENSAQFAIMIGPRDQQGRGLGTLFGVMLHAFAFRCLKVSRVMLSIVPANQAGRRSYEKLGYLVDRSPEARESADDESDLCMSVGEEQFLALHRALADRVRITPLP